MNSTSKKSFFLLFAPLSFIISAQTDSSLIYYHRGVSAFSNQSYRLSDSMFSISLKLKPHPDTYFSRSITRLKMNNREGYCVDLCYAASLGDKQSDSLFCLECGTKDISYTDFNNKPATLFNHAYYNLVYQSDYKNANIAGKYDLNNRWVSSTAYLPDLPKPAYTGDEKMPEPAEGLTGLLHQIRRDIRMPMDTRGRNINGKVFIKFIVNRLGYIEVPEILKGIDDCKGCDFEALRLVASMPRWNPGSKNGKYERIFYTLPIVFRN